MSCWRVLELSHQPDGQQIPQLLIKPRFGSDAYTIFLTDLSNIWSDELDLSGIVDRAYQEESPIEVSKQDTAQLAVLLENIQKSLASSDDTSCRITRDGTDDVVLHTTISLPEPLDSLSWRFNLRKQTSVTLKNELILPLLVSAHIQNERINSLLASVTEKDKAITRLLDQYESNNLDLAAAFPSISGLKSGRRLVKREQATRHIPGLQTFKEDSWKKDTGELDDTDVSTLGLFQEALAQCTPKVPPRLKSDDEDNTWWVSIATAQAGQKLAPSSIPRAKSKQPELPPRPAHPQPDSADEETEDEFETHENFKLREAPKKPAHAVHPAPGLKATRPVVAGDETADDEEDEEDLDAPLKSQSQAYQRKGRARAGTSTPDASTSRMLNPSSPAATLLSKAQSPPPGGPKAKGFRIGGKATKAATELSPPPSEDAKREQEPDNQRDSSGAGVMLEGGKARKPFKIGGKSKAPVESKEAHDAVGSPKSEKAGRRATKSHSGGSSTPAPEKFANEGTPMEEHREETAEEKAERKRSELKRKNEEILKKQAQSKKKKRF